MLQRAHLALHAFRPLALAWDVHGNPDLPDHAGSEDGVPVPRLLFYVFSLCVRAPALRRDDDRQVAPELQPAQERFSFFVVPFLRKLLVLRFLTREAGEGGGTLDDSRAESGRLHHLPARYVGVGTVGQGVLGPRFDVGFVVRLGECAEVGDEVRTVPVV